MIPLGVLAQRQPAVVGELTFTDEATNTNRTTFTFDGLSLGDPHPTRVIAVSLGSRMYAGRPDTAISSVTIAGVTATQAAYISSDGNDASVWYAAVPTGTTGTVEATWPDSRARCFVSVHRLAGGTVTVLDSAASGANPATLDLDVSPSGGVIACVYANAYSSNTFNWTGINLDSINTYRFSVASIQPTSPETPRSVSVAMSNDTNRAAAAASFQIGA